MDDLPSDPVLPFSPLKPSKPASPLLPFGPTTSIWISCQNQVQSRWFIISSAPSVFNDYLDSAMDGHIHQMKSSKQTYCHILPLIFKHKQDHTIPAQKPMQTQQVMPFVCGGQLISSAWGLEQAARVLTLRHPLYCLPCLLDDPEGHHRLANLGFPLDHLDQEVLEGLVLLEDLEDQIHHDP
ncbi:hypothetical protein E2C01_016068 [Portunus trituberculatus]|uniref:Uncharacterized protein n=1 Tax=Portunus trituberculatus TaxID=210409 RepID=A0A5B7DPR9_PORTR|nr:hypothetical protein [Portunus trituberculatus]